MNLSPRRKRRQAPATVFAATLVALTVVLVTGCNTNPRSGQLATPTFSQLHIPDPFAAGAWIIHATSPSPPPEVLPTRGRGVRLLFHSPEGATFSVSLRALDGTTVTPLTENQGTPAPPEAGYFQIVNVDAKQNPAAYLMYLRTPLMLADPANFDILVVNRSLRTDVTDSAPMVVSLRQRKVFTVTVKVQGNGRVTSTPSGIQCGSGSFGSALTDCSRNFGPGQVVSLAPASADPNSRFIGWSGNCPPNVQVCGFTLDGTAAVVATAHFGATTIPTPASSCTAAPVLPGLKWIGLPDCAFGTRDQHPGISVACDASGYFCCEPGPQNSNAPRCGGQGKIESPADCRHLGIEAILRQPGGCYEVNSFP